MTGPREKLVLVDTNIIVYLFNKLSNKHKSALEVYKSFEEGKNASKAVIAHQNFGEAYRILTHPKFENPMTSEEAVRALDSFTSICEVISPNLSTYGIILHLLKKYKPSGNKYFDFYLVATMLANDISRIMTFNKSDFDDIDEISVVEL